MALADDFANGFSQGFYLAARGAAGRNYKEGEYDPFILLGSFIGFLVGAAFFIKGLKWFRRKRLIENTPTSMVRSIAMGFVEVYGAVVPIQGQEMLKNPVLNKDCVYYRRIEEVNQGRSYRNPEGYWSTVKDEEAMKQFYLKDDTGKVLVDPKGAIVDLDPDGLNKACVYGADKRITVYSIEPQNNLYILGTAGKDPGTEQLIIQKGKNYYSISDDPEGKLLANLRREVLIGVYGGAAMSLVCLAIILYYLKVF